MPGVVEDGGGEAGSASLNSLSVTWEEHRYRCPRVNLQTLKNEEKKWYGLVLAFFISMGFAMDITEKPSGVWDVALYVSAALVILNAESWLLRLKRQWKDELFNESGVQMTRHDETSIRGHCSMCAAIIVERATTFCSACGKPS